MTINRYTQINNRTNEVYMFLFTNALISLEVSNIIMVSSWAVKISITISRKTFQFLTLTIVKK